MTDSPVPTDVPAGEFISDSAVRRVIARRRVAAAARAAAAKNEASSETTHVARADAAPPAREARTLRRWSVAELIARGLAASRPQA